MITEKAFATSHHAFWRDLLPAASSCVRRINVAAVHFGDALESHSTERRGVINETGFRVFARAISKHTPVAELSEEAIEECWVAASNFILRFRAHSRVVDTDRGQEDLKEAKHLASRLQWYFDGNEHDLVLWPRFAGCGWLDEVEGDILIRDCLYEVKAGGGPFRAQDLRQVLCYAALSQAAGGPLINYICLINPRTGVVFRDTLDAVCIEAAGNAASDTLNELISYISEPLWEPAA